MSKKPKKDEEEIVDPVLDDEFIENEEDPVESDDTAEIDFDRRRARDWEDLDNVMDENDY